MDKIAELKEWLIGEANAVSDQHKTLGDDRLILQGRHEAIEFIVQKIDQLGSVEAEALAATEEESATAEASSEASEQEG
jgi:hypothetical protein